MDLQPVDPERRTMLLKVSTGVDNLQLSSSSKLYQWDSRGTSSMIARGGHLPHLLVIQ